MLIDVLHRLADQGNTVIVIEHNTEIMAEADYIIDMGPGPGEAGGTILLYGEKDRMEADGGRWPGPRAPKCF